MKREDKLNLNFKKNPAAIMGKTFFNQEIKEREGTPAKERVSSLSMLSKEKAKGGQTPPSERSTLPSFEEKSSQKLSKFELRKIRE